MKTKIITITALAFLLAFSLKAQIIIDLTTGIPAATGSPDDNWEVKIPGATSFTPAFISSNQILYGAGGSTAYGTNNCGNWISPYIEPGTSHILKIKPSGDNVEHGDYIYRMFFELDSCDVTSAAFNLNRIGADNSVSSLTINGNPYTFPSVEFLPLETRLIPIVPGDLIPGSNVIEFTVNNLGSYTAFMICGNLTINTKDCQDCGATPDFEIVQDIGKADCNKVKFINNSVWTQGTPVNYHWDFGDGITSTAPNPTHGYEYNGTYNVTLTMTGVNEEGVCCTEIITKTVTINCPCTLKPFIKILNDNCTFSFTGSNLSTGTTHPIAWHWDFGDGTVGSGQFASHEYKENGVYTVSLTVVGYNGDECCNKTVTTEVQVGCVKECVVNADFSYTTDDVNDEIDFTNESTISGGFGPVYLWDFGDSNTSTLANPSHAYTTEGDYLVTLTITIFTKDGCCTDQITFNVHVDYDKIIVIGGNGHDFDTLSHTSKIINASPNPTSNQFNLKLNKPVAENVSYQVLNLEGIVLLKGDFSGEEEHQLLLSDLKPGMYILSYTIKGERQQMNIIKE